MSATKKGTIYIVPNYFNYKPNFNVLFFDEFYFLIACRQYIHALGKVGYVYAHIFGGRLLFHFSACHIENFHHFGAVFRNAVYIQHIFGRIRIYAHLCFCCIGIGYGCGRLFGYTYIIYIPIMSVFSTIFETNIDVLTFICRQINGNCLPRLRQFVGVQTSRILPNVVPVVTHTPSYV